MSIVFVDYPPFPDSPYEVWVRGELEGFLSLPEGSRAEIIEGDIVVSPAPRFAHNAIVDKARSDEVAEAGLVIIGPSDMTMAVEVTSPSNADHDREPGPQHRQKNGNRIKTKWADYASAGVEYYLLVDCDPRVSRAILYSEPNPSASRYEAAIAWNLGAPIVLPEPFGLTVDTADWKAWS
ncbi:Uma2 family endonuclease [Catenulispora pinisilvae]|uniref:Uma2 family endonuclease n=1 Tax=Catenulispora pinisilvae TaxID=2705253 RepID=UPI001890D6B0|nr:Uma2 family endonuclease [Catenulispora pinisilvae]